MMPFDELGWQVVNPKLTPLNRMDIGDFELTYIEQGKGPLVVLVLGNHLPAAESVILTGASHGLQMENPEDFGVALMEFLSNNQRGLRERTVKRENGHEGG